MKWFEPEKKNSLAGLKVDDDVPAGINGVVAVFGFKEALRGGRIILSSGHRGLNSAQYKTR
jgi:hypothetical protein